MADLCTKCGRWVSALEDHECPPQWRVWCPDESDSTFIVLADDPEEAAEKWCHKWDEGDSPPLIAAEGNEYIVIARKVGGQREYKFAVSGEYDPVYYVGSVDDE